MHLLNDIYVQIILSSMVVYLFIILIIRLLGKKELTQMSVIDFVFILLISNSVQNAMVGPDNTLIGGLVSAATLFICNYIIKMILFKFPKFNKIIQGEPILLIYKGRLNHKNLIRAKMTLEEVKEAIRENGVSSFGDVDLAVLEVDGNISILSDNYKKKTVKKRKIKGVKSTREEL